MKIELHSVPHRKIRVADILKNPHRNLELNPVNPARIEELLESFERTGFWGEYHFSDNNYTFE